MACLSLGKIDKNIIPLLIGCIFEIICSVLIKVSIFTIINHIIISMAYTSIFYLLAFIPFIILKIRLKKEKSEIKIVNNKIKYIYTDKQKEITKYKYLYILLSSALFYIRGILIWLTIEFKFNCWIFDIFIYCLFNYLIFKTKLYKHHYLSIIIITLFILY